VEKDHISSSDYIGKIIIIMGRRTEERGVGGCVKNKNKENKIK
jgi:hypothetical protein